MITFVVVPIRAYTHKELAALYDVSWPTFQRWLEPHAEVIGPKLGHFYNAKQVESIFEKLGRPGNSSKFNV
jgi:hypothetical protein